MLRALELAGFSEVHRNGSHVMVHNRQTGNITTVPDTRKTLSVALIASILRQAGITGDELRVLLK
jgi:predicted RNA binding protein YcfA (HicA-like mRNA interferase family)